METITSSHFSLPQFSANQFSLHAVVGQGEQLFRSHDGRSSTHLTPPARRNPAIVWTWLHLQIPLHSLTKGPI
ncbi:MAG: hypothetical protein CMJ64_24885 [Planctomycetaceae bacterium]|nr:hypothetical protein [Planctomycetaceae bacterium]